ncbi:hypothetical protein PIB30_077984 [Stylosanthes scabra]|uniref:Uncharacterized protein n=1 Tax=Stylosanthes scabra TaxID=79078 RepID=A0ABU6YTF4_9FABA|nr:hypothetical protein [Stylosanthes scabra]
MFSHFGSSPKGLPDGFAPHDGPTSGGSSGESRDVVRRCDGGILKIVVKEQGELCSMWRLTLEEEIVVVQV